MAVYLPDISQILTGQGHQVVVNIQIMFPNDVQLVFTNQGVIGDNGAGNGVFNGHHPFVCFSIQQGIDQGVERKAFHQLDFPLKILRSDLVVVGSPDPLYGNSQFLHYTCYTW